MKMFDFQIVGVAYSDFASVTDFSFNKKIENPLFIHIVKMITYEGTQFQTSMQGHDYRTNLAPQAVFDTLQVICIAHLLSVISSR